MSRARRSFLVSWNVSHEVRLVVEMFQLHRSELGETVILAHRQDVWLDQELDLPLVLLLRVEAGQGEVQFLLVEPRGHGLALGS